MDINELNTKLVSELREIAKVLGIGDVDKLRKQELIDQISKVAQQTDATDTASPAAAETETPTSERPRKRNSNVKADDPISVGRNQNDDKLHKIDFHSKSTAANVNSSDVPVAPVEQPVISSSTPTDFDNVNVNEVVLEIMADGYGF